MKKLEDLTITIPAAINDLPITLTEKAALAHIARFPRCSNARLAKLLGMTERGIEALLRRLRQQGYFRQTGQGPNRECRLTFTLEHDTKCGNQQEQLNPTLNASHEMVPVTNKAIQQLPRDPWEELQECWEGIAVLLSNLKGHSVPYLVNYARRGAEIARTLPPDDPRKETAIAFFSVRYDVFFAWHYAYKNLSDHEFIKADNLIGKATPEQLSDLRQKIEANKLEGNPMKQLVASFNASIEV